MHIGSFEGSLKDDNKNGCSVNKICPALWIGQKKISLMGSNSNFSW